MITQELLSYIQRQRESGVNEEALKNMLLDAGWQEEDVFAAMSNQPAAAVEEGISPDFQPAAQDAQAQTQPGAEAAVAMAPQTSVQNTANQQPAPRKRPFLRRFLLIILLLALIAGGVFAYLRFWGVYVFAFLCICVFAFLHLFCQSAGKHVIMDITTVKPSSLHV